LSTVRSGHEVRSFRLVWALDLGLRGISFLRASSGNELDPVKIDSSVLFSSLKFGHELVSTRLDLIVNLLVDQLSLRVDLFVVSFGVLNDLGDDFLSDLVSLGQFLVKFFANFLLVGFFLRGLSFLDLQDLEHFHSASLSTLLLNLLLLSSRILNLLLTLDSELVKPLLKLLFILILQVVLESFSDLSIVSVELGKLLVKHLLSLLLGGLDLLLNLLLQVLYLFLKLLIILVLQGLFEALSDLRVVGAELAQFLVDHLLLLLSSSLNLLLNLDLELIKLLLKLLVVLVLQVVLESLGNLGIVGVQLGEHLVEVFLSLHSALDELGLNFFVLLHQSLLFPELGVLNGGLDLRSVGLKSGELVLHLLLLFLLASVELLLELFSSLLESLELEVLGHADSGVVSLDLGEVGVHLLSSDGLGLVHLVLDLLKSVDLAVLFPRHLQFLSDLRHFGSG
jgi:hypothetical protein